METHAFWSKLKAEHPRAEAFCRRLAGDRDEGDDLYQDTIVRALDRVHTLRDPEAFRPWFYRVIVNNYRNRCHSPWWKKRRTLDDETCASTGTDPIGRYAARRWLARALAALKPAERALIVLFEIDGWTLEELSRLSGRPVGTIKARLSRTRKKMRQAIERRLPVTLQAPTETESPDEAQYGFQPIRSHRQ